MTDAGISTTDALRTATLVPGRFIARYLPNAPGTGVIKEGYVADLLLLSANPLQDVQSLRKIEGVMSKGTWYTREQLLSLYAKVK